MHFFSIKMVRSRRKLLDRLTIVFYVREFFFLILLNEKLGCQGCFPQVMSRRYYRRAHNTQDYSHGYPFPSLKQQQQQQHNVAFLLIGSVKWLSLWQSTKSSLLLVKNKNIFVLDQFSAPSSLHGLSDVSHPSDFHSSLLASFDVKKALVTGLCIVIV